MVQGNVCDNPIQIDVSQIPEETKFYIASATYDFYMRLLKQPEIMKRIDERLENKKKATPKKGECQNASTKCSKYAEQ